MWIPIKLLKRSTSLVKQAARSAEPSVLWAIAAGLPAVGLLVTGLLMVLLGIFGWHPLWHENPLSLSEAAVLRDAGLVLRQLLAGERVNARYAVRPGFAGSELQVLSPIEAAVEAERVEITELLIAWGATADPERRRVLICRAMTRGAEDIVDFLVALEPRVARETVECRSKQTP